jgi:hypothetical protein
VFRNAFCIIDLLTALLFIVNRIQFRLNAKEKAVDDSKTRNASCFFCLKSRVESLVDERNA